MTRLNQRAALIRLAARRRAHERDLRILRDYLDLHVPDAESSAPADLSAWASVGRWRGGPEGGAHWVRLAARAFDQYEPGRLSRGYEGMTLAEVGEYFNVTGERIRMIEAGALRKLRHPSRAVLLRSFLGPGGATCPEGH